MALVECFPAIVQSLKPVWSKPLPIPAVPEVLIQDSQQQAQGLTQEDAQKLSQIKTSKQTLPGISTQTLPGISTAISYDFQIENTK